MSARVIQPNPMQTSLRYPLPWRGIALLLLAAVAVLSLVPSPPRPPDILAWDKAQHTLAYLVLGWWCSQCWPASRWRVALGLVLFGAALEALQSLSPVRQTEWLDMAANTVGVAAGALLALTPLGRCLVRLESLLDGRRDERGST